MQIIYFCFVFFGWDAANSNPLMVFKTATTIPQKYRFLVPVIWEKMSDGWIINQ